MQLVSILFMSFRQLTLRLWSSTNRPQLLPLDDAIFVMSLNLRFGCSMGCSVHFSTCYSLTMVLLPYIPKHMFWVFCGVFCLSSHSTTCLILMMRSGSFLLSFLSNLYSAGLPLNIASEHPISSFLGLPLTLMHTKLYQDHPNFGPIAYRWFRPSINP